MEVPEGQTVVFLTRIPRDASNWAEAKNVISQYRLAHKDILAQNEVVAMNWAVSALQDRISEQIRATINDFGPDFWAEIFGVDGSKCQYSQGGLCTKNCGDPDGFEVLEDCGYCFWHQEKDIGKSWPICIKTRKAELYPA